MACYTSSVQWHPVGSSGAKHSPVWQSISRRMDILLRHEVSLALQETRGMSGSWCWPHRDAHSKTLRCNHIPYLCFMLQSNLQLCSFLTRLHMLSCKACFSTSKMMQYTHTQYSHTAYLTCICAYKYIYTLAATFTTSCPLNIKLAFWVSLQRS